MRKRSAAEERLAILIDRAGIPKPERELVFARPRRWRFDFAWPDLLLAVEVEGISPGFGSRHQRIGGFLKDCEKYEAAVLGGWMVYRVPTTWIEREPNRVIRNIKSLVEMAS